MVFICVTIAFSSADNSANDGGSFETLYHQKDPTFPAPYPDPIDSAGAQEAIDAANQAGAHAMQQQVDAIVAQQHQQDGTPTSNGGSRASASAPSPPTPLVAVSNRVNNAYQEIANGAQAAVETYNAEKKAAIEADEERNGGLNWNAPDAPGPAPTATGGSSSQGSSSDSSQVTPFEDTVVADPVPAPAPTLEPSEPVVVEGDSVPAVVDVPEGTNSDAAFGTNCDPAFPDCETDPVAPRADGSSNALGNTPAPPPAATASVMTTTAPVEQEVDQVVPESDDTVANQVKTALEKSNTIATLKAEAAKKKLAYDKTKLAYDKAMQKLHKTQAALKK